MVNRTSPLTYVLDDDDDDDDCDNERPWPGLLTMILKYPFVFCLRGSLSLIWKSTSAVSFVSEAILQ
jgi:hypothetical protein